MNLGPNQLHDELISGNQEDFVLTAQKKRDNKEDFTELIQPPKDQMTTQIIPVLSPGNKICSSSIING